MADITKKQQKQLHPDLVENGYLVLKNFLTEPLCHYYNMVTFQMLENPQANGYLPGSNGINNNNSGEHHRTWNTYGHPIWETTLHLMQLSIAQAAKNPQSGIPPQLFPTYSYHRMYMEGAAMAHHSDRPACQVSLTINLGQTHEWPIYVTNLKTKKYTEVIQKPGDALMYLGCNVGHYRPPLKGDWYSQLFVHYVLASKENQPHFFDNQTRSQKEDGVLQDPSIWMNVVKDNWKQVLHQQEIMDKDIPYNLDDYKKEAWYPLEAPKHPFRKSQEEKEKIKMHHLDEKDMISKDQYDFEMSEDESTIDSINSDNEIPDGIEVD